MKKYLVKKYFVTFWLIIVIFSLFLFVSQASAASSDLEIDYPGKPGPLFSVDNIAPTDSFQESVTVTNNSDTEQMFAFRISQITNDTHLADVLRLQVKRFGTVLLDDTIANLKNPDEREISNIPAKSTAVFDFIVTMKNVGNAYQGLHIETADFTVGFSSKGQVLGVKDEQVLGEKIKAAVLGEVGNNIILALIYSFIIASGIFIFKDKRKRKKLAKVLSNLWISGG